METSKDSLVYYYSSQQRHSALWRRRSVRKEEGEDLHEEDDDDDDDDEGLEDEDEESLSDHKDSDTEGDSEENLEVSYTVIIEAFRVLHLLQIRPNPPQVFGEPTAKPELLGPPEINPSVTVDDPGKVSRGTEADLDTPDNLNCIR